MGRFPPGARRSCESYITSLFSGIYINQDITSPCKGWDWMQPPPPMMSAPMMMDRKKMLVAALIAAGLLFLMIGAILVDVSRTVLAGTPPPPAQLILYTNLGRAWGPAVAPFGIFF